MVRVGVPVLSARLLGLLVVEDTAGGPTPSARLLALAAPLVAQCAQVAEEVVMPKAAAGPRVVSARMLPLMSLVALTAEARLLGALVALGAVVGVVALAAAAEASVLAGAGRRVVSFAVQHRQRPTVLKWKLRPGAVQRRQRRTMLKWQLMAGARPRVVSFAMQCRQRPTVLKWMLRPGWLAAMHCRQRPTMATRCPTIRT